MHINDIGFGIKIKFREKICGDQLALTLSRQREKEN